MERQEKKKRKTCRRTKLKSTTSLPQELTTEILLRLPGRSVLRFRCVSKLWLSITTDPYFINLFETPLSTLMPSLLVCFKKGDKLFVSSIPQHQNSDESSQPIYHMELPEISCLRPTELVHGLICFQNFDTPIVWNPSKRQCTLTKPSNWLNTITTLLGYDPIENKHKVMCIPLSRSSDVCRVLTLGSGQETWRTVKTNHRHGSDDHTSGRCIKGVIYYQAYLYHPCVLVIMSFDVRSEKFGRIDLPSDIRRDRLINYEGRLACVDRKKTWKSTLWILEDGEKHKWSSKDFLEPFEIFDESLRIHFRLNGFTHAGELIYVPYMFNKSYCVLFFDPVRRSYRRLEFKGIADYESRSSKGVKNRWSWSYPLHTFPNYI